MERYQPFPQFAKPIQNVQMSSFVSVDIQRQDTNINTNILSTYKTCVSDRNKNMIEYE